MRLLHGDCLKVLKELPANYCDAMVTDPPAGIAFMGKDWDTDKGGRNQWIYWLKQVMSEALRVLKPGAHGLVWALPRTSHWTAMALENAGFEVRDVIVHIYGQGFPKSLAVDKEIEKYFGSEPEIVGMRKETGPDFADPQFVAQGSMMQTHTKAPRKAIPITKPKHKRAKEWQGWGTALKPASERWILCRKPIQSEGLLEKTDTFNAQEWEETILSIERSWNNILDALSSRASKSTIKTVSDLTTELKTLKCLIFAAIHHITTLEETIPSGELAFVKDAKNLLSDINVSLKDLLTISAQGNVTNLAGILVELTKMRRKTGLENLMGHSSEDFILIRKPLIEDNVAKNTLKWRTGGINIEGSRIKADDLDKLQGNWTKRDAKAGFGNGKNTFGVTSPQSTIVGDQMDDYAPSGRFPSNLVFTHSPGCDDKCVEGCPVAEVDRQSGILKSGDLKKDQYRDGKKNKVYGKYGGFEMPARKGDSGGASRFFYCAKISSSERNAGLEGMEKRDPPGSKRSEPAPGRSSALGAPRENHHPTVKPTKLMSYLIKLITPPGGSVLDPFMGSGSTGVAAKKEGFRFVGIEKEKEYYEIAKKRIDVFYK